QQIPENILITKTAEILGVTGFDRETLMEQIKEILVPKHYCLVYVFHDWRTKEVTWQHKSRRESWTDEMRQKARENARRQAERRKK
ncbi:recombinase family protein, partial [Lachnospiraceae bacterium]|nr:recombinase family protein [Lachnospiraceae bacterium]